MAEEIEKNILQIIEKKESPLLGLSYIIQTKNKELNVKYMPDILE